jgi:acyl transferase domain-containing protein
VAWRRSAGRIGHGGVGGVNTLITRPAYQFQQGRHAERGRSLQDLLREANGYVRGEGVAMLVLKKLADAERDGDHIYGVVRGVRKTMAAAPIR